MKESGKDELTLWILYAQRRSDGAASPIEIIFIYAQDDEEAAKTIERWEELHPEYLLQSYEPRPEGFIKDGIHIPGKKAREEKG